MARPFDRLFTPQHKLGKRAADQMAPEPEPTEREDHENCDSYRVLCRGFHRCVRRGTN
jgi:hypothetical protein